MFRSWPRGAASRRRIILVVFGVLALTGTATGCARSAGHPRSTEPSLGPTPVIRTDSEIQLPLDAYLLTSAQNYLVAKALNTIGRSCMSRFGLSWPATPPWIPDSEPLNARRYSVLDLDRVRVEGYHTTSTNARHAELAAAEAALGTPSSEAQLVWSGSGGGGSSSGSYRGQPIPDGGCVGEADRVLSGSARVSEPGLAARLQLLTFQKTKGDSRVIAAFAAWRDCMLRKGFDYRDPFVIIGDIRWQTPQVTSDEVMVAIADVECKTQTSVPGVMAAVETAYQNRAIAQNARDLRAVHTFLVTRLANAGDPVSR